MRVGWAKTPPPSPPPSPPLTMSLPGQPGGHIQNGQVVSCPEAACSAEQATNAIIQINESFLTDDLDALAQANPFIATWPRERVARLLQDGLRLPLRENYHRLDELRGRAIVDESRDLLVLLPVEGEDATADDDDDDEERLAADLLSVAPEPKRPRTFLRQPTWNEKLEPPSQDEAPAAPAAPAAPVALAEIPRPPLCPVPTYARGADMFPTNRGDAAAATWIVAS